MGNNRDYFKGNYAKIIKCRLAQYENNQTKKWPCMWTPFWLNVAFSLDLSSNGSLRTQMNSGDDLSGIHDTESLGSQTPWSTSSGCCSTKSSVTSTDILSHLHSPTISELISKKKESQL